MPADATADQERKPDSRPAPAEEKPEGAAATGTTPAAGPATSGGLGAQEIQRKASVGAVDDPAEKAADAEADRVMRMPEPAPEKPPEAAAGAGPGAGAAPAGNAPAGGAPAVDEPVRRQAAPPAGTPVVGAAGADEKPAETGTPAPAAEPPAPEGEPPARGTPQVSEELQQYLDASRGKGAPLPEEARKEFEGKFQRSFADVRIHDDSAADDAVKSIDALAFTRGNDIYFRAGSFDPTTDSGKRLLAHELAHVVQQRPGVNRAVVHRKVAPGLGGAVIRRAKNASSGGKASKDVPDDQKGPTWSPPASSKAPKGTIDTNSKTLEIEQLPYPKWKEKAGSMPAGPYKWRRETRPATPQLENWKKGVRDKTKTKTKERLTELYGEKPTGEPYFAKSGSSTDRRKLDFYVGSPDEIAEMILVPTWARTTGKYNRFDAEHKIDWQLTGGDDFPNIWLFDSETNRPEGTRQAARIRKQVIAFYEEAAPYLKPKPRQSTVLENYAVSFKSLKYEGKAAADADFWEKDHAGTLEHGRGLKKLTSKEIESLKGSPDNLQIFSASGGGRVKELPFDTETNQPKGEWKKKVGKYELFQVNKVAFNKIGDTGGTGNAGHVEGVAFKDNELVSDTSFKVGLGGMPGLPYAASLLKSDIKAAIKAKGLSPTKFPDLEFDPFDGLLGRGKILPEAKLLEKVDVGIVLDGDGVGIEAIISGGDLVLPGPFQITGGMLRLYAGTGGLAVEGQIDFEIEKLAKGYIKGEAGLRRGGPSFALEGKLDFDTEMFTEASLGLSYKDGKWGVTGRLAVGPDKIKGIKRASVQVDVQDDTVTATGDFETSIKGVDKGKVGFKYDPSTGMEITGEIELGKGIPGVKSGKLDATVKQGANGWTLAGGVTIQPNVPGLTGNVTGRYEDGAFLVEADLGYERGRAKGSVKIGVTNQAVGPDGKPAGPPQPDGALIAYGGGSVTLTITPWLQGTVGLLLKPNGEIEVTGEVRLPSSFEVFPEKKVEKRVFSIGLDIPIIGVAVAGQRIGIFATIRGGMDIRAGFGPGQLKDVSLRVTYNPDHEDQTTVTGTGTFFVPAGAGLRLSVDGGLGAGIPIVSATAGLTIFGEVGVEGAASASATVTWTPAAGVVLDAKGELSVQPKFKFGIEAFVDVSADLVLTTIELYKKRWSLASFEYGSNLTFGLVFPIHYESGKPFDISFDQIQWKYPQIEPGELLGGLMKQLVG